MVTGGDSLVFWAANMYLVAEAQQKRRDSSVRNTVESWTERTDRLTFFVILHDNTGLVIELQAVAFHTYVQYMLESF